MNYDFVFDDRFLDPDHPEFLMYYDVPGGKQLVGYMYMVPLGQEGLQIGGPLTRWHYHLWATPSCILNGRVSVGRPVTGKCAEGQPSQKSPEMLHVWLVDHPDGRFASKMSLPRSLMQSLGEPGKASN